MTASVEVFADITCPFTHVGLRRVVDHVAELDHPVDVIVRAWPLEWVNDGAGLDFEGVKTKAAALREQLGIDDFSGLRADTWPSSTIPALNLVALAYGRNAATGLAVSLAVRTALFEHGLDVSARDVLAEIASAHGLSVDRPTKNAVPAVRADYESGIARNVSGSPHFWVGDDDFFCPALELGRDDNDHLTANFDAAGLARFFTRLDE